MTTAMRAGEVVTMGGEQEEAVAPHTSPAMRGDAATVSLTRVSPALVAWHRPAAAATEALRALYYRLMALETGSRPQVVAVTSAGPGEGRTLTATNLALVAARALGVEDRTDGRSPRLAPPVALLEADLRAPRQAALLGVDVGPGLGEYLTGRASLAAATRALPLAGLSWMPGGAGVEEPARPLASPAFESLIAALRSSFPLVIIDAPPLSRAESQAVLRQADGVLLVVRAGTTDASTLVETWRDRSDGVRWLGAILTQAESGSGS